MTFMKRLLKTLPILIALTITSGALAQSISVDLTADQVEKVRRCVDLINYDRTNAVPPLPAFGYKQWFTNNIDVMLVLEVRKCEGFDETKLVTRYRVADTNKQQAIREILK